MTEIHKIPTLIRRTTKNKLYAASATSYTDLRDNAYLDASNTKKFKTLIMCYVANMQNSGNFHEVKMTQI